MKRIVLLTTTLLMFASTSYAAVSGEALMNVQDTTAPTGVVQTNRVKDLGTNGVTGLTSGVMACGDTMWDTVNTVFTAIRGDTTNGLWAQIKNFSGSKTPSDAYANPTDAIDSFSLTGVFNGTTWDRAAGGSNNADAEAVRTLGLLEVDAYGRLFNGTNWDRSRSGINTGQALVDNSSNTVNRITTNTTTAVKATGGYINEIIVNATNASAVVTLYNIASAGCTGTPASGFITGPLPVATVGQIMVLNHTFPLGICAVTAGGAATDISVLFR